MTAKVSKKIVNNNKKTSLSNLVKIKKCIVGNPQATAVWLVENTSLTFPQIADFCQLYDMEVQAIANGTFATNVLSVSPIGVYLNKEEIERCQKDENANLEAFDFDKDSDLAIPKTKTKKYKTLLQRRSKTDAILWVLTFSPEVSNKQICKLLGTTENTVESIRNRSHRSLADLTPKDPVIVGLCTQRDIDNAVKIAREKIAKENKN